MRTIVLISGGFDPLHSGHVSYINAARKLGDWLIVGINSDDWLRRKKGQAFLPFSERSSIISNLRSVDEVIGFDDSTGSANNAILEVRSRYPNDRILFANGGDRTSKNIPEQSVIDDNLEFVFGVGGEDKKNSSSWILAEWKAPRTTRPWGFYRVLHDPSPGIKVKELTVLPGCQLSMQRHNLRSEFWFVSEGTASINTLDEENSEFCLLELSMNQSMFIERRQWHRLCNKTSQLLKMIEIQYGERCEELDIERLC
jgi:D-beta-D-heptose 7-phosphate kinase/D-beta-D-heptose 1-phosphate adenosyltransferase